jgi:dihydrofolate reductase
MRKLIFGMLTSLDLYVEDAAGDFGWAKPDAELHRHFNARAAATTTHLYGRRMWETMSAHWPTAESNPAATPETLQFARAWNAGEHIVFSRTLAAVEPPARLVREDAVAAVRRLKAGEGSDMEVSGPGLAADLIAAGLVDEIEAYVNPVVVGAGKPFLPGVGDRLDLKLIETETFCGGVVRLRYEPRAKGG